MGDEKAIETVKNDNQALSALQNTGGKLASLPEPAVLKKQLERTIAYREMINEHILSTFTRDVHYYRYHFLKSCTVYKCRDNKHLSNTWEITAPGAKKLCADFLLFPDFKIDTDTQKSFGGQPGLVFLVCFLYTIEGKFYSSGRGNSKVGPYNDENKATKMAQKSSLIDALKSSGLLSDFENTISQKEGGEPAERQDGVQDGVQDKTEDPEPKAKSNNWCESCPAPGPYHSKHCQEFTKPESKPKEEVMEGEVV